MHAAVRVRAAVVRISCIVAVNGTSQELAFEQKDGAITFTLPSLKYWSMIVME